MADNSRAELCPTPGALQPPAVQSEPHRPLLNVDHTGKIGARRQILLPVDDTDDSEEAIQWAVQELYNEGDVFHLMHVIPEPQMVHIWAGIYVPPEENAELMEVEDTKTFVSHRFARKLMDAKVPFKLHVIVGPVDSSSVASVIQKKARDLEAACIVMAKHSKGRIKAMWAGSVTLACLQRCSNVPVVVVPAAYRSLAV